VVDFRRDSPYHDRVKAGDPRVSVIIATYNWSSVLPYSIGSALRQTFADFEVLVVGDGCTDDSEAVVRAVGDDRVHWINLESNTRHQSGPNNEGLRRARGEFVAYLGHDDLWLPHHLVCLVDALAAGADLAFGITEVIGPKDSYRVAVPFDLMYTPGTWIPPTGVAHRRRVTESLGGWRHYRDLAVDPEVELWQRMHDAGCAIAFVPRLTAVKFSASERPDSYVHRSYDEQAAWFSRIHGERDVEAVELAMLLTAARRPVWKPYRRLFAELVHETVVRTRRRLPWRAPPPPPPAPPPGQGVDQRRKAKGLEGDA
jgi:glycosyltransferase involved in cell wall biosynthesis